jgi:hypothetical protein
MHAGTLVGVLGRAQDRARRSDREIRLLHAELDVESDDVGGVLGDHDQGVGGRGLGGDPPEVEHPWFPPTAASVDGDGFHLAVRESAECVPPMRGMSTTSVDT